jgi:REP-associated tyrosine transposase
MTEIDKMHPKGMYFVTLTVIGGIDVFTRYEYCDLLIDNLNYCIAHNRLRVYEYVILPSTLSMVADVREGNFSKALRDFKKQSARQILRAIAELPAESRKEWLIRLFQHYANRYQQNAEHHFWQFGNQPIDLDKLEKAGLPIPSVRDKLLTANFIDTPEHYRYCSVYPLQQLKLAGIQ